VEVLQDAWREVWHDLGVPAPDDALRDALILRYGEPHRHYHTLQHLEECLALLRGARAAAAHPGEVALALWFHDAVYDPLSGSNEAESAAWARRAALSAGLAPDAAARIHALVLATRHDAPPASGDAALVADIDLAILGADAARFDEYERQVRAEYAPVPDALFRNGRRRILERILARERIFTTPAFHARYEARARGNIERSLAAVRA
jgi:predicted metal-dependent HD superfamily phosphohydrolase